MKLPTVDHVNKKVVFKGPGTGFKMLDQWGYCILCKRIVQLCRVGMFAWFHRRCCYCLSSKVKIE